MINFSLVSSVLLLINYYYYYYYTKFTIFYYYYIIPHVWLQSLLTLKYLCLGKGSHRARIRLFHIPLSVPHFVYILQARLVHVGYWCVYIVTQHKPTLIHIRFVQPILLSVPRHFLLKQRVWLARLDQPQLLLS